LAFDSARVVETKSSACSVTNDAYIGTSAAGRPGSGARNSWLLMATGAAAASCATAGRGASGFSGPDGDATAASGGETWAAA